MWAGNFQRRLHLDLEAGIVQVEDHARERREVVVFRVLDGEDQPDGRDEVARLGQQVLARLVVAPVSVRLRLAEDLPRLLASADPSRAPHRRPVRR
ncbi:hypothetical protein IM697_28920 [Streptomyces ferrugineus]|uniref:Uncharacterized protein n=1 Tax=Streptomyces ferrugineus TaxID=1413221 RepID=A0A7M2SFB8_9ACTN|nr:hypothetical protein [Streptomyces ferrugineus]QOV34158.1 hypothetical protein IM697_28920 [Streptomyces ferrugineus]